MQIGSAIAIYFITWWMTFFVVLPFGGRRLQSDAERVAGSDAGAPARTLLLRKVLITTALSVVVFAGIYWILVKSGLTLADVPLPMPPAGRDDPAW
jgi:predicted secreted protein